MAEIEKAVIPVAGLGTRLLPATKSQPKEMLPVGRKPIVQYVVEEMIAQGVKKLLFITGRKKRSIEDHFDEDPELAKSLTEADMMERIKEIEFLEPGVTLFFTRQSAPLGLGDAVRLAEDFVGGERFVVALGDSIIRPGDYSDPIKRLINTHIKNGAAATIIVEEVPEDEVSRHGIVSPLGKVGAEFEISDIVEKPPLREAPSRLAAAGRYVFDPVIFEAIRRTVPERGGELELTDAIRILLKMGHRVWCVKLRPDEKRYDIGDYESYFKAFIDFAIEDEKYGYIIRDYVQRKLREI